MLNLYIRLSRFSFFCWTWFRFTLSGKVLGGVGGSSCAGQGDGPAGVKVTLTPVEGGEPVATVLTDAGGNYKFENLLTGMWTALWSILQVFTSYPAFCHWFHVPRHMLAADIFVYCLPFTSNGVVSCFCCFSCCNNLQFLSFSFDGTFIFVKKFGKFILAFKFIDCSLHSSRIVKHKDSWITWGLKLFWFKELPVQVVWKIRCSRVLDFGVLWRSLLIHERLAVQLRTAWSAQVSYVRVIMLYFGWVRQWLWQGRTR